MRWRYAGIHSRQLSPSVFFCFGYIFSSNSAFLLTPPHPPSNKTHSYRVITQVGVGTYGSVWEAVDRETGDTVRLCLEDEKEQIAKALSLSSTA